MDRTSINVTSPNLKSNHEIRSHPEQRTRVFEKWEELPQTDPSIMFCFNTIWDEMKPHLIGLWLQIDEASRELLALLQNYTKISLLILWEMKVFWAVRGKLHFLTSEHPKNCIYVTWVMKRPAGLWEGFYHPSRCLCTERDSGLDIFPQTPIWE